MTLPATQQLAAYIDHAILRPELSRTDVIEQLDIAAKLNVFSVCVRPMDVAFANEYLKKHHPQSGTLVTTVVGFPHGTTSSEAKAAETKQAIKDGAKEIDMVVNISALKSKDEERVISDIRAVIAASENHPVKVILEVSLLDESEIILGASLVSKAGAAFVKTSTGFAGGGATPENIALLRKYSAPEVQVKASGAVRDKEAALAVIAAGASRIGTSSSAQICGNSNQPEDGLNHY